MVPGLGPGALPTLYTKETKRTQAKLEDSSIPLFVWAVTEV